MATASQLASATRWRPSSRHSSSCASLEATRGLADRIDRPANLWLGVSVESQPYAFRADHLSTVPAAVRFLSIEPLLGPVELSLDAIGWVIAGGESGTHSRPVDPEWVRSIRDACQATGTPFFFKQWGGRTPKSNGRILDGRTWDEYPALPSAVQVRTAP